MVPLDNLSSWFRKPSTAPRRRRSKAFKAIHGRALGGLLDLTAAVLRELPAVNVVIRHRLSDHAEVLAALDRVRGSQSFEAFAAAREAAALDVALGDPFVMAVRRWSPRPREPLPVGACGREPMSTAPGADRSGRQSYRRSPDTGVCGWRAGRDQAQRPSPSGGRRPGGSTRLEVTQANAGRTGRLAADRGPRMPGMRRRNP